MSSHIVRCAHIFDVHTNKVNQIDNGAFTGLKNLELLDLNRNELTELKSRMFEELASLQELRMAFNK